MPRYYLDSIHFCWTVLTTYLKKMGLVDNFFAVFSAKMFLCKYSDVQTTENRLLEIFVKPWSMAIKSLTLLLLCNLLAYSNLSLVGALLLIFTWLYSNPRSKFKFSEKAGPSLKYSCFQDGGCKTF